MVVLEKEMNVSALLFFFGFCFFIKKGYDYMRKKEEEKIELIVRRVLSEKRWKKK